MSKIRIAFVALALATSAPAQDPPSDYYASIHGYTTPHCCSAASLVRVTPSGLVTTIFGTALRGWVPFSRPVVDHTNRTVYTTWLWGVLEIDATTDVIRRTVNTGVFASGLTRHHAVGLTTVADGTVLQLSQGLTPMTTIGDVTTSFATLLHGRDLWTGDYIATDGFGRRMYFLSTDGRTRRRTSTRFWNSYLAPSGIVQSHVDGDFLACVANSGSAGGGIVRLAPRPGRQRLVRSSVTMSAAVVIETSMGGGVIRHLRTATPPALETIALDGTVLSTVPIAALPYGRGWGMCRAAGQVLSARRTATPNRWDLRVNSPTDVGLPYAIALSATGFTPGIRVGARTLALVPDALFALSIRGALGPLFTGNIGVLPAAGVANATLDLRRFGNALSGLRVWAAAAIFDPAAPNGIRRITRPEILVLD